ncbi:MAG: YncE family protein, partial [candidate division WOR-3 bacterium]
VINGVTNNVITTITVGDFPRALTYNATNNKVYCANSGGNNVTVIDGVSNGVITTIAVGNNPCALIYNPINNKIYCANAGSNNVTVIDGANNSVITTITVGSWPRAFTWNPVQNRTYVANYNSATVSVIRDSLTGIEELPPSASPFFLDIYPNPTKTIMTISASIPLRTVEIYDVLGNVAKTEYLREPMGKMTIPLEHLSAGVYFVKVISEGTESIRKVIVTR